MEDNESLYSRRTIEEGVNFVEPHRSTVLTAARVDGGAEARPSTYLGTAYLKH